MRTATAIYDRNGILVAPYKFFNGNHRTRSSLTMAGGYWHFAEMWFTDPDSADKAQAVATRMILENNGTVFAQRDTEGQDPNGNTIWGFRIKYVIEEPDHIPCHKFAARTEQLGIDPGFRYVRDYVAEHGPDFRIPEPYTDSSRMYQAGDTKPDRLPPRYANPNYGVEYTNRVDGRKAATGPSYDDDDYAEPDYGIGA